MITVLLPVALSHPLFAPGAVAAEPAELVQRIQWLHGPDMEPVVLGTPTATHAEVAEAARGAGSMWLRVWVTEDREGLEAKLAEVDLQCGVWVDRSDDGRWALSPVGRCPAYVAHPEVDYRDHRELMAALWDVRANAPSLVLASAPREWWSVVSWSVHSVLLPPVRLVPPGGDPRAAVERALGAGPERCGVVVDRRGERWTVTPLGWCGGAEVALPAPARVAGSPSDGGPADDEAPARLTTLYASAHLGVGLSSGVGADSPDPRSFGSRNGRLAVGWYPEGLERHISLFGTASHQNLREPDGLWTDTTYGLGVGYTPGNPRATVVVNLDVALEGHSQVHISGTGLDRSRGLRAMFAPSAGVRIGPGTALVRAELLARPVGFPAWPKATLGYQLYLF